MAKPKGQGVTLVIDGDYSLLQKKLNDLKSVSKGAGAAMAEAMQGGVMYGQASRQIDLLAASMAKAKANVQALDADFQKAEGQLKAVAQAAGLSEKQFAGLAKQMTQKANLDNLERSMGHIQRLTGASAIEMAKLRASVGDVDGAFKSLTQSASAGLGKIVNMKNAVVAAAAALGFREFANITSVMTDLESRARIASKGMIDAGVIMGRLKEIADRAYSPLEATANAFMDNATALNALGYSMEKQLNLTDALTNALVVSGAKGQQFEMVMDAVTRSLATGKMAGRELDMVLKYGGAAAEVLAKHLGTTVNGLRQFAKEGKLTADVITRALIGSMDELRAKADAMPATISDAMVKFGNNLKTAVNELDKSLGQSRKVVEVIDTAGAHLKDLAKAVEVVAKNADLLAVALGTRLVVSLATSKEGVVGLAGAFANLKALSAGAARALGGPWGVALTTVATGFYALYSEIAEAGKIMDGLAAKSAKASEAIARTATEAVALQKIQIESEIATVKRQMAELDKAFQDAEKKVKTFLGTGRGTLTHRAIAEAAQALVEFRKNATDSEAAINASEKAIQKLTATQEKFASNERVKQYVTGAIQAIIEYKDGLISLEDLNKRLSGSLDDTANAMDDTAGAASAAASAHYDLAAAMREVAGIGSAETNTLQGAIKALDQLTAHTKGAEDRQKALKKATMESSLATLKAAILDARDARNFPVMLENERLYAQYLKDSTEALKNNFKAASTRGGAASKAAREAEKALRDEAKARELVLDLEKELASLTGQTAAAQVAELNKQIAHWQELARRIKDAAEQARAYALIAEIAAIKTAQLGDDAMSGLRRAADAWMEAHTAAKQAEKAFNATADAIGSAFADMITGSKSVGEAFGNMATTIVNQLARIAAEMLVVMPIVQAFKNLLGGSSFFGGLFGVGPSGVNLGGLPGVNILGSSPMPSAKGNVFASDSLAKYANQIVTKPTYFEFAKGGMLGLMGEAGAEAVMPLERDSRGRLGVIADYPDYRDAPEVRVNVHIDNNSNTTFEQTGMRQSQGPDGLMDMDIFIRAVEDRMVNRMKSNRSKLFPAVEETYNLNRARTRRLHLGS